MIKEKVEVNEASLYGIMFWEVKYLFKPLKYLQD